jgi:hypothetical protein
LSQPTPDELTSAPQIRNVIAIEDPALTDDLLAASITFRAEAPATNSLETFFGLDDSFFAFGIHLVFLDPAYARRWWQRAVIW